MSAYCEMKTVYKDANLLIEALKAQGFTEVEQHNEKTALVGYSHEPTMYANIIVRKAHTRGFAKDFGYALLPDGTYGAVINDMDLSRFNKHKGNIANTYAETAYRSKAKKLGLRQGTTKRIGNKLIMEYVQV